MEGVSFHGSAARAEEIARGLGGGARLLFALVMSYTATCEMPGISAAGASPAAMRYTPAADAELIHYGSCRCISGVPATPDGRPTPALLTRAALRASRMPFVAVRAGSAEAPQMPFVETGIAPGGDIARGPAMRRGDAERAVESGRAVGELAASVSDGVIIGESVPGGTTTALAVMRGLGADARVSSSMVENPSKLKRTVADAALARLGSDDPLDVLAQAGDPMLAFAAGMASAASRRARVLLAGGTQMAAAFMLASRMGMRDGAAAVATTKYVIDDETANMAELCGAESVPVVSVDPRLELARASGMRAFAEGHAKEGAGAGGAMLAAMLSRATSADELRALAEDEHARLLPDGD